VLKTETYATLFAVEMRASGTTNCFIMERFGSMTLFCILMSKSARSNRRKDHGRRLAPAVAPLEGRIFLSAVPSISSAGLQCSTAVRQIQQEPVDMHNAPGAVNQVDLRHAVS
jgi:hypothetical protein